MWLRITNYTEGRKDPISITPTPKIIPKGPIKKREKRIMPTPEEITFKLPLSGVIAEKEKIIIPNKTPKNPINPNKDEKIIIKEPKINPIIL